MKSAAVKKMLLNFMMSRKSLDNDDPCFVLNLTELLEEMLPASREYPGRMRSRTVTGWTLLPKVGDHFKRDAGNE